MLQWGHIRTFTPWQYIVDATAEKQLAPTGWTRPAERQSPTGAEIVERYLVPLAAALGDTVRTGTRVLAVSREGLDRSAASGARNARSSSGSAARTGGGGPAHPRGHRRLRHLGPVQPARRLRAAGAGGGAGRCGRVPHRPAAGRPWRRQGQVRRAHNPGGRHGPLGGEHPCRTGAAGREVPGTRIVWAIRGTSARRVLGGGTADQLPDRGRLGSDLADLVATGAVQHLTGFSIRELRPAADDSTVAVVGDTPGGSGPSTACTVVVAATGFRPTWACCLSCGSTSTPLGGPAGDRPAGRPGLPFLRHRRAARLARARPRGEPGFFVVGMKSYGRAPTFQINDRQRAGALDRGAPRGRRTSRPTRSSSSSPRPGVLVEQRALSDEDAAAAHSRTRRAAAPPPGPMPSAPGR